MKYAVPRRMRPLAALLLWAGCESRTITVEPILILPEPALDAAAPDGIAVFPDLGCMQTELCDHMDNDCDGATDEDFDLATDAVNCGDCGNVCAAFPNAFPKCEGGVCVLGDCFAANGCVDLDGIPDNGCEYCCLQSNGGAEICDGIDNDCNGITDDGYDLLTDMNNCGYCGNVCERTGADQVDCIGGTCVVQSCIPGNYNCNGLDDDGCEYQCVVTSATELCNGIDDNCDCQVDEGIPSGGPCCPNLAPTGCVGECQEGIYGCFGGNVVCMGGQGPVAELCDGLDNDCDGLTDEDFDFQNSPTTCGGCTACNLPHAYEGCQGGVCTVQGCEPGYVNLDGDIFNPNGCEYACSVTGVEICDGQDNDCDGLTDAADPSMAPLLGNPCHFTGPCAGATATCTGGAWCCQYGPGVETAGPCTVASEETLCDGIDGNCDGSTDESFPVGDPCTGGTDLGACADTGTFVCDTTTTVRCNITSPGASPQSELCNNVDDDCDGLTDETSDGPSTCGPGGTSLCLGVAENLKLVTYTTPDFYIYTYEASRPDATSTDIGTVDWRSCSNPGVRPWAPVTWYDADAACAAAGMRLCTAAEWQDACEGSANRTYPYGNTYGPTTCNGTDYDPTQDAVLPTGSLAGCVSMDGAFDMSGNVKEWTDTQRVAGPPPAYEIRGGAYDNIAEGLTCQFDFVVDDADRLNPNRGFRCCCAVGEAGCPP
jgi:sulfatase-modifying factor enzyme 1/putative metal-binding protein